MYVAPYEPPRSRKVLSLAAFSLFVRRSRGQTEQLRNRFRLTLLIFSIVDRVR